MKSVTREELTELLKYFPNLYVARTRHHVFVEELPSAMRKLERIRHGKRPN